MEITQKYLLECFIYEDGQLIWKERPKRHFRSEDLQKKWNGRFGGKPAGWVRKFKNGLEYLYVCLDGRPHRAHRLIWVLLTGEILSDKQIDHIDGCGTNNNIENLRIVTNTLNNRNHKLRYDNTTGFRGVSLDKARNKYISQIGAGTGKRIYLGSFDTADAAHEAYVDAAARIGGYTERHLFAQ